MARSVRDRGNRLVPALRKTSSISCGIWLAKSSAENCAFFAMPAIARSHVRPSNSPRVITTSYGVEREPVTGAATLPLATTRSWMRPARAYVRPRAKRPESPRKTPWSASIQRWPHQVVPAFFILIPCSGGGFFGACL